MSTTPPTDPTQPTPAPSDAQPTEVYPPATGGYGASYAAPAAPSAPEYAAQAPYTAPPAAPYDATAPYGTPAGYSAVPSYGARAGYPAPTGPDTRSKGVAWTALILAVAGILLCLLGFVPLPWLGFFAVLIGSVALLAAFVVSIVGLVGRRNGGKGLSVTALVLSVVGSVVAGFALLASLIFVGIATVNTSIDSLPSTQTSDEASDGSSGTTDDSATTDDTTDGSADQSASEAAYLAAVRPEVNDIMMGLSSSVTSADIEKLFPDESLLLIGRALLVTGESGIDSMLDSTVEAAGGAVTADQVRPLYEAIYQAADAYLR